MDNAKLDALVFKLVQSHIRIVPAIIGNDAAISLGGGVDDPRDHFALIITTGPNGAHAILLQEPRFRAGINLALSRGSHVKKSGEEIPQILPRFKTDARDLRRGRDALRNDRIVAIAAEGLETERVDLGAAEPRERDSNIRYRGRCRRSGRSRCLARADFPAAGNPEEAP